MNIRYQGAVLRVPSGWHCCNTYRRPQSHPELGFSVSLQSVIFLPNAFGTDFTIPSPAVSPPPAHDNVAYMPKESSE